MLANQEIIDRLNKEIDDLKDGLSVALVKTAILQDERSMVLRSCLYWKIRGDAATCEAKRLSNLCNTLMDEVLRRDGQ